jgi:hypothetical protein
MKTKRLMKHHIDGLVVLLLFGVFAACVLSVLLLGADAYKKLTERDQLSYDQRTAIQYLATKVRQADRAGAVTVEDFQGVDALVLREDLDGEVYLTRVYCYDGYLRELSSAADADLSPADGEQVLAADSLLVEEQGNALRLQMETDGSWQQEILALRSGEGASS